MDRLRRACQLASAAELLPTTVRRAPRFTATGACNVTTDDAGGSGTRARRWRHEIKAARPRRIDAVYQLQETQSNACPILPCSD
jgi:hypothetical protein